MAQRKGDGSAHKGLLTSALGSIYDVPDHLQHKKTDEEAMTRAGTTVYSQSNAAFAQDEKAVMKHPFKTFYTTGEEVKFESVNKFEGRSSYFSYFPTGEIYEQKLEHVWFAHANKKLSDKRRDEETQQFLKEWAGARGRMESEI